MAKIAFLFPGQGSQSVGMGKDLCETFSIARQTFEEAGEITGTDYGKLCFEGPEDLLKRTDITQPTVFLVSIACLRILQEKGISPVMTAGNSLGEYGALVAAGSLSFKDALLLVEKRGKYMHDAAQKNPGSMAAIIGLEREQVDEICAGIDDIVAASLFNSPGQIVVSGTVAGVEAAIAKANEAGAKKTVILPVSGAWHSELMRPAEDKLATELANITIQDPSIPLVANVPGDIVRTADEIRAALVAQLTKPVLWVTSVERMMAEQVDTYIEVGPGKVVRGLVKRIAKDAALHSTGNGAAIEKTIAALG